MAENYEHPDHDEPAGGSPPEGDFPTDFFDDATEPPPVSMTPHETPAEHPLPEFGHEPPPTPKPTPTPPPTPPDLGPPPVIGPPSAYKAPALPPADEGGIKKSAFPFVLGALMAGVLGAAWFISKQKEAPTAATGTPTPASTVQEPPTPSPSPAHGEHVEALEGKIKDLTSKLDELTAEVKGFKGKVDDLPKPEPAPDLKPLEGKINDLTKSVAGVTSLNDKVEKLGDRLGTFEEDSKSLKGELAALREEMKSAGSAPKPANEPKPEANDAAALTEGADLFKAGKYKEADQVFKKLASTNPKDARVYYFAALTRGLTTNDWQGETLATAAKGAELEKAGSPKAPEVDAAFADVPSTLKPWVAFFRKQAR